MHIHLVSAIFASREEFRAVNLQETMETILADGLSERGITVTTSGHNIKDRWSTADVVHVHHLANACLKLFLPQSPKIVFTRHATKPIPTHHRLVLGQTYRSADAVVVLSDAERQLTAQTVPNEKIHTIRNGVRADSFSASQRSIPDNGPFRLLYVGQLVELKRVEIAIELVHSLRSEGIDVELDLVYHRSTLEHSLRSLSRELKVHDYVHFLGPHTRSQLGTRMSESHLLIHPSRTEALPTVLTEALLTGLPVAAFNVGGIREQVYDALVLPSPFDIDQFGRQIRKILDEYSFHAQAAYQHSSTVRQNFNIETMIDNHLQLYSSLVE